MGALVTATVAVGSKVGVELGAVVAVTLGIDVAVGADVQAVSITNVIKIANRIYLIAGGFL